MSSSSVVPVVLWGRTPPTHCISCIITTYDQKTIVTGSSDGQLGVWDLRHSPNNELTIVPRTLIFGHGAKVTALARANDGWDNKSSIISASENGEICLWDTEDGLCIQSNVIPGTHTSLHSFQVTIGAAREWRLIVHGDYSDAFVVDALSLEVIYTLRSPIQSDWISSACVVRPARRQEDVVVALTLSGVIKIWSLKPSLEIRPSSAQSGILYHAPSNRRNSIAQPPLTSEPMFEQELKEFGSGRSNQLSCNPFTQRTILIVGTKEWQLYDSGDFKFLSSAVCQDGQSWLGGDFVLADHILLWNKAGNGYLYKLPPRCCPGVQELKRKAILDYSTKPVLISVFKDPVGQKSVGQEVSLCFSYGRRGPFYKLLLQGNEEGRLCIWKVETDCPADAEPPTVYPSNHVGLTDAWQSSIAPCGLIDSIEGDEKPLSVTASLYIATEGRMVCGRSDGSIIVISAAQAAKTQLLKSSQEFFSAWPPHLILHGHQDRVTCLLYPHEENPRYDAEQLVSGGADFSVILWNAFSGTLLHRFCTHGGEIIKLLCTPPDCSPRVQSCICSVAHDHSVALLGLRERKCILLASCHTFPVQSIKWRAQDDFMIVSCTDGSIYVWQMETGHLDRCENGQVAIDILAACDEENRSYSSAGFSGSRGSSVSKRIGHIASTIGQSVPSPATIKKIRKTLSSSGDGAAGANLSSRRPGAFMQVDSGDDDDGKEMSLCFPFKVIPLRANTQDSDIHIMLFDTEALICLLLTEENAASEVASKSEKKAESKSKERHGIRRRLTSSSKKKREQSLHSSSTDSSPPPTSPSPENTPVKTSTFLSETHDVAQLMISSLHAWEVDPNLDKACMKRLGLLKPAKPLAFGLMTRGGRFSLMLPGWYCDGTPEEDMKVQPSEKVSCNEVKLPRFCYLSHWQLSPAITTQHLVGIVSVANTLMSMNQVSFLPQDMFTDLSSAVNLVATSYDSPEKQSPKIPTMLTSEYEMQQAMQNRAQIKAGWSQLAALHCCLLPDVLKDPLYKPPLLHVLARRWQDRCLEVREAAQAILLAELRRIGVEGRRQVVNTWAKHLPKNIEESSVDFDPVESLQNSTSLAPLDKEMSVYHITSQNKQEIHGYFYDQNIDKSPPSPVPFPEEVLPFTNNTSTVVNNAKKLLQYDSRRRQATAIVLLAVIGAEFQKEIEPIYTRRIENKKDSEKRKIGKLSKDPGGEVLMDSSIVCNTGKALMFLLLQPPSQRFPAHTSVRRAAIDLIGRGFTLWEPYMDVSSVLLGLLELCVGFKDRVLTFTKGLPLTPSSDAHRSARHALSLISTARPSAFIATLAKEVARSSAAASSISFNQPSPAAIAVYSHVRHQPAPSTELSNTSILHRAKTEILRIIELMIEKTQQDVVELLIEVVDIVVHCLDYRHIKEKGLAEIFPALCRFNMVSYCNQSRRLAVGGINGQIAFYELRSSRCQLVPAHSAAITALSFSPDGKILASYSSSDSKIHFWQIGSSLLGMLSGSIKCIKSYSTIALPPEATSAQLLKLVRLVWINHKNVILLMADGTEYKFSA